MERLLDKTRYKIYENDQGELEYFIHLFLHEWNKKDIFEDVRKFQDGEIASLELSEIRPEEQKTEKILCNLINEILIHLPKTTRYDRAIEILYVPNYQDKFYQDIYAAYYSGKHFSPDSSCCSRFFLFDSEGLQKCSSITDLNDAFIGIIVRRPLPGREIGRTLINPKYLFDHIEKNGACSNIWKNNYHVTMYGIPLTVPAFPYTMQDGEVATCAETSIMNLLDYFSARYSDYKMLVPSKISEIVRHYSNTRNLPSPGLTYEMISKVLMETGFSPKIYKAKEWNNEFIKILHSYVASGIPVAVGLEGGFPGENARHSIIIIGTPRKMIYSSKDERIKDFDRSSVLLMPDAKSDKCYSMIQKTSIHNQYVVMDDRKSPYSVSTIHDNINSVYITYNDSDPSCQSEERWEVSIFSVPLGREMMMDADTAILYFESLMKRPKYSYITHIHSCQLKNPTDRRILLAGDYNAGEKPLMARIFLCSSRRLKEQRIQNYKSMGNYDVMLDFQEVHLPHFVWVCELYSYESYTNKDPYSIGEIILDATTGAAHDDDSAIVWIQYPGMTAYRHQREDIGELRKRVEDINRSNIENLEWQRIMPFQFEDIV